MWIYSYINVSIYCIKFVLFCITSHQTTTTDKKPATNKMGIHRHRNKDRQFSSQECFWPWARIFFHPPVPAMRRPCANPSKDDTAEKVQLRNWNSSNTTSTAVCIRSKLRTSVCIRFVRTLFVSNDSTFTTRAVSTMATAVKVRKLAGSGEKVFWFNSQSFYFLGYK